MLPVVARTCFRAQEFLLGRRTFTVLDELRQSQYWPRERIDALRLDRFRALAASAYAHAPYWRQVMTEHGIAPDSIRSLDDVRRFPFINRQTLQANREAMAWRAEGRRVQIARTSGSTNEALQFYTSSNRESHITAARMRGHEWVGVRPGDKEVYFWAAPVEINAQGRLRQVRDFLTNNHFSNALLLNAEITPRHIADWARWGVNCIFGYVSSATLLAQLVRKQGLDVSRLRERGLRAIVTTSELLSDADRRFITETFGVPAYDSYGLREGGLIGHDCDHGTLHTNDEQLILEVIDPQTLQPAADGTGELVVTMLLSQVQPVIRYRTGDIVTLSDAPCPCGRRLRSLKVSGGRMMDFLVTRNGNWVSCVAILYVARTVPGIVHFQARQEQIGHIHLLVAVDGDFPPDGKEQVLRQMRARLQSDDEMTLEIVDSIDPAPSGKYRPVISKVAEQLRQTGGMTGGQGFPYCSKAR
jgi:phenylacetate-CoA ligase